MELVRAFSIRRTPERPRIGATTETVDVHYAGQEAVIIQPYTHTRNYQPRDSYLIDFCCCDSASSSPYTLSTHSGSPFLVDIKKKEPGVHPGQEEHWGAAVRQNDPIHHQTHWITENKKQWKTNKTVKNREAAVNHKPCFCVKNPSVRYFLFRFTIARENPTT